MQSKQRAMAFLFLATIAALVAVVMTRQAVQGARMESVATASPQLPTRPVVVASRDLEVGRALALSDLALLDLPVTIPLSGVYASAEPLVGRALTREVEANEPILEGAVAERSAVGGLSALVRPNRRAVAVKVDAVVGVGGFVSPRSKVDVIATIPLGGDQGRYTNVILQDIMVLAIDQTVDEIRQGESQIASVVTLEVTPEQAQKLSHATSAGRLQLALRNPDDKTQEALEGVSARDLLMLPGRALSPEAVPPSDDTIEVILGSKRRQVPAR